MKFELNGLEFDDLTILKIKPVTDNLTINPLHHFIQSYNGHKVLLFLYSYVKTANGKIERCLHNGTDRHLTEYSLPKRFLINENLYYYENKTWKVFSEQT